MTPRELDFGEALYFLKRGKKLTRAGWNGKGMWIEIQFPAEHSEMTRPYLVHVAPRGTTNHYGNDTKEFNRVPWLPSNTDILAEDWEVI